MIYYYSATGNSKWLAESLAGGTKDALMDIVEMGEKGLKPEKVRSGEVLGIVFPIYAWSIPKIMLDFIKGLEIEEGAYVYVACTYGGSVGYAIAKLQKLFPINAAFSFLMPDAYIILFDAPKENDVERLIRDAEKKLPHVFESITERKAVFEIEKGSLAFVKSYIVPPLFKFIIKDKPFYVEGSCISCGLCESVCPVKNIRLSDGKPVWQGNCTHCCGCINSCPQKAIQYGKATKSKGRYLFPKKN